MRGISYGHSYHPKPALRRWNIFWASIKEDAYIFDDHDEEGQFYSQCLLLIRGTCHECRGHVGAHDLQHWWLDILVRQAFDMTILNCIKIDLLFLSQIWSGLLPILYKIDRNPDWYVFLNISETYSKYYIRLTRQISIFSINISTGQ